MDFLILLICLNVKIHCVFLSIMLVSYWTFIPKKVDSQPICDRSPYGFLILQDNLNYIVCSPGFTDGYIIVETGQNFKEPRNHGDYLFKIIRGMIIRYY